VDDGSSWSIAYPLIPTPASTSTRRAVFGATPRCLATPGRVAPTRWPVLEHDRDNDRGRYRVDSPALAPCDLTPQRDDFTRGRGGRILEAIALRIGVDDMKRLVAGV